MGVDFSKLKAKMNPTGRPGHRQKVIILDSLALKKSWGKQPSYWVEILYDEKLDVFAIGKRWSYWSKAENKQVTGESVGGRTSSPGAVHERFVDAVNSKLTQEYEIVGRKEQDESPAKGHDFGGRSEELVKAASVVAEPVLGRKPSYDVW
jgi:hypothetical protein